MWSHKLPDLGPNVEFSLMPLLEFDDEIFSMTPSFSNRSSSLSLSPLRHTELFAVGRIWTQHLVLTAILPLNSPPGESVIAV